MSVSTTNGKPTASLSAVKDEIARRIDQAWEDAGFVDDDGGRNPEKMQEAAYQVVIQRIVTTKEERSEVAITKGELYAAVFPDGPGADGTPEDSLNELDVEVFHQLERDVWSLMQAKATGAIQKRLGEEESPLLLCQATIRHNMNKAPAVYLTENKDLIMEDSVDKEIKALERKAQNLQKQLEMVMRRQPDLAAQILGRVNQGLTRTQTELEFPMQRQQLEAGESA